MLEEPTATTAVDTTVYADVACVECETKWSQQL